MLINFRDTKGEFKILDNYKDFKNDPTFAISITANTRGFLPASTYISMYGLSLDKLQKYEDQCNALNKCLFISNTIPGVIIVPHTKGKNSLETIDNFVDVITKNNIETLHFTHYNWLLSFPEQEIRLLLTALINPKLITTLKVIYIDTPDVFKFQKILNDIRAS